MRIVFFGTPAFSAHVLEFLINEGMNIVAVISKPDKPKGRSGSPISTPVKEVALKYSIPLFQPELVSALEFQETLAPFQADLFVVVAYGEIIKQHLLDMPKLGCINLHTSLLPKYRGAAPIQRCIIEGEQKSGVTIMHMVRKMDAGDIIETVEVPIGPETTFGELENVLCEKGKHLLLKVILDFEKGIMKRIPQNHDQVTLAQKIELEDCEIRWNEPAQKLHNLIRGVNPYPGAWSYVDIKGEKKRLKILKSKVHADRSDKTPGKILSSRKENLLIACGSQSLELLEIQLEGKKAMSSAELVRGIPLENLHF